MGIESVGGILYLILNATIVVKIILGILVIMSISSWTIIFYKILLYLKIKKEIIRDHRTIKGSKDLASALKILKTRQDSILYNISLSALSEIKQVEKSNIPDNIKPKIVSESVEAIIKDKISKTLNDLSSSLSFLATCTNSAPFIGLFGTVWGIMHSFHSIGLQKTAALAAVAPGIAEALIATAFGLGVAIPASIAYNSFLSTLGKIQHELYCYKTSFMNRAQREISIFTTIQSVGTNKDE
jgi:biopolymer transport protein TolQ